MLPPPPLFHPVLRSPMLLQSLLVPRPQAKPSQTQPHPPTRTAAAAPPLPSRHHLNVAVQPKGGAPSRGRVDNTHQPAGGVVQRGQFDLQARLRGTGRAGGVPKRSGL